MTASGSVLHPLRGTPSTPLWLQLKHALRDLVTFDLQPGDKIPSETELCEALPELLWLTYLGVTLFWVHDRSPDQARTRVLINGMVPLLVRVLRMARLPAVRSVVADAVRLVAAVRS